MKMKRIVVIGTLLCLLFSILSVSTAAGDDNPQDETSMEICTKVTDMPTARLCHGMAEVKGKLYLIGGGLYINGKWSNVRSVEEYDLKTGKWTKKAAMPTQRGSFGIAVANNKIYTFGGVSVINGKETVHNSVEEYDPAANKWTVKKKMLKASQQIVAATINGKIFVIGGSDGREHTVEVYNPAKNTWEKRPKSPFSIRSSGITSVGSKIYLAGGHSADGNGGSNALVEYDTGKNTWKAKKSMSLARTDLAAFYVKGKIYAIGGWSDGSILNAVEEYDIAKDRWAEKEGLSYGRSLFAISLANNKVYISGGTFDLLGTINEIEAYDPVLEK